VIWNTIGSRHLPEKVSVSDDEDAMMKDADHRTAVSGALGGVDELTQV
jgi:hypothetical protein